MRQVGPNALQLVGDPRRQLNLSGCNRGGERDGNGSRDRRCFGCCRLGRRPPLRVGHHAGLLLPEEINENALRGFMSTHRLPDPDLVIRSGGERRLSDFLLFECSMAELFFSDHMWPEFDESMLDTAFEAYRRRQRRFGRTPEQRAVEQSVG